MASYQRKIIYPSLKLRASVMLVFSILLFSTGCSKQKKQPVSTPSSSELSQSPNADKQLETLHIAVIPAQSSQKQAEELTALAVYLQKSVKRRFSIHVQKNYDAAVKLLVTEQVQIAYLGPLSYVKAKQQNPNIKPIVAPITKATGRPWHTSMIIANSERIKAVKDLPNKRFGFVSKSSTTGFLVPSVELFQEEKINLDKDFEEVKFLGSHDLALAALVAGEVDAVAVEQEAYIKAQQDQKIDKTKYIMIWESSPLPTAPIVISTKLDSRLENTLKKALIDAPQGIVAVSGVETAGYTLVDDMNYETIRTLQAKLDKKRQK